MQNCQATSLSLIQLFTYAKSSSHGMKSGLQGGRKRTIAPVALIASIAACVWRIAPLSKRQIRKEEMNLWRRAIFLTENLDKGGNNYFTTPSKSYYCQRFSCTHYEHRWRVDSIKWKQVGAQLFIHKVFKCCSIDVPLIKAKINHSFCTKNGNGGYAQSPVLRHTFHLSSFTDRATTICTFSLLS